MAPVEFNFEQGKRAEHEFLQRLEDAGVELKDIWKRVQGNEAHPLARWMNAAEGFYLRGEPPSALQVQLTRLAGDVAVLDGVVGIEERLRKLCSGNETDFYATYHEITTAARYAHAGIHIAFIPTSSTKSPDLLLNDEVEIECKSRARDLTRVIKHRTLCHDVLERLSELVRSRGDAVGVLADLRIKEAVPRRWARRIVSDAQLLLEGEGRLIVLEQSSTTGYRLKRYPPTLLTEPGPNDPSTFAVGADLVRQRGLVQPDSVGKGIRFSSYVQVSVRGLNDEPAWDLQSVLKSAAGQLSGTRPGIIEVEVTPETYRLFQDGNTNTLMKDVSGVLRNYSRVSAVRVATRYRVQRPDGLKMGQMVLEFPNEQARIKLPPWMALPVVKDDLDLSGAQALD